MTNKGKLLRVEAPHFVAGALWQITFGEWECYHAAPILRWLVGMSPQQAKEYLNKRGWKYEWL